jgi:transcription termination factor Rho
MSVLDREALEQSPLADLHAVASELSIDGYRLLRREQLVDAILARQQGTDERSETEAEARPRRRRGRRGGASRAGGSQEVAEAPASASAPSEQAATAAEEKEKTEPSTAPASDRARFEALEAKFPDEPFAFDSEDRVLSAIQSLTPIGKGSRATIVGPSRSGKSAALRRLADAFASRDDVQLMLVLVGVRPEEISEWQAGPLKPLEAMSFASPAAAQDRAVYGAIDRARSVAVAGEHAVILLDTLDGVHEHAARRALATARRLLDGGSVTVIATSSEPIGGETTVIKLDPLSAEVDGVPALDLRSSGTLRAELLVGEDGASAIARARAEAVNELSNRQ